MLTLRLHRVGWVGNYFSFYASIEVNFFLEPLIDPLAKNHNASTIPVVDGLDHNTLEYKYNPDPKTYMVGGFEWNLIYKW